MSIGVNEATLRRRPLENREMRTRVCADGQLDRFALVRCGEPRELCEHHRRGGRRWELQLELDFDPTALGEYWLANCHGFLVDTPARTDAGGVVDDVRVDPATGRAVDLEVATGWFGRRRRILPVEDVWGIVPQERRLLTRPPVDSPDR